MTSDIPPFDAGVHDLIVRLVEVSTRTKVARELALRLGAEELIIFALDSEIGLPLPAQGFQQTLPNGAVWQRFLARSLPGDVAEARLNYPDCDTLTSVKLLTSEDGTRLILLGGEPFTELFPQVERELPLLGAIFRAERIAIASEGNALAARQASIRSKALAKRLDETRAELEAVLAELKAANRAKDDFIAVVSHELRTPLNAVMGWVALMRGGVLEASMLDQALDAIERNARQQATLVDSILDYAQIASGKMSLELLPRPLAPIVRQSIEIMIPSIEAKSIRLHTDIAVETAFVKGDSLRLQQILLHVLSNATKFTPQGGEIWVCAHLIGSSAALVVHDTGEGIEANFLPHVFEQFKQADGTSSRPHSGLGLGLALTQRFVELHGGTIVVQSEGKDRGTTVTITLPLVGEDVFS